MMKKIEEQVIKRYPVFAAYDTGKNYIFWCPFCERLHTHGKQIGHKGAHCIDRRVARSRDLIRSPFHNTGYILQYAGIAPKEMLQQYKRQTTKPSKTVERNHEQICLQQVQYTDSAEGE